MTNSPLPAASLDSARERVVERLSTHYARDQLTLEELESRLERVYAARSMDAIESVLAGLPGIAPTAAPSTAVASVKRPRSRTFMAVMSGVVRRGAWLVPKRIRAVAFMGGVELDLRYSAMDGDEVIIDTFALWGGIEIWVPPHWEIVSQGLPLMGAFEDKTHVTTHGGGHDRQPRLIVRGVAIMGGVEIKN